MNCTPSRAAVSRSSWSNSGVTRVDSGMMRRDLRSRIEIGEVSMTIGAESWLFGGCLETVLRLVGAAVAAGSTMADGSVGDGSSTISSGANSGPDSA